MDEYIMQDDGSKPPIVMLTLKRNLSLTSVPVEVKRQPRVYPKPVESNRDRFQVIQVQDGADLKSSSRTMTGFGLTQAN